MRNVPHRLTYLNTWSVGGAVFRYGHGVLEGVALLEEAGH